MRAALADRRGDRWSRARRPSRLAAGRGFPDRDPAPARARDAGARRSDRRAALPPLGPGRAGPGRWPRRSARRAAGSPRPCGLRRRPGWQENLATLATGSVSPGWAYGSTRRGLVIMGPRMDARALLPIPLVCGIIAFF